MTNPLSHNENAKREVLKPKAINLLCGSIEDKYGNERLNRPDSHIPEACWVVYLVFTVYNYALNEGLANVFSMDIDHGKLGVALEKVGLQQLRKLYDGVCNKLGVALLGNREAIIADYGSWKAFEKNLEKAYNEFCEAEDVVFVAVGTYCAQYRATLAKYVNWPNEEK